MWVVGGKTECMIKKVNYLRQKHEWTWDKTQILIMHKPLRLLMNQTQSHRPKTCMYAPYRPFRPFASIQVVKFNLDHQKLGFFMFVEQPSKVALLWCGRRTLFFISVQPDDWATQRKCVFMYIDIYLNIIDQSNYTLDLGGYNPKFKCITLPTSTRLVFVVGAFPKSPCSFRPVKVVAIFQNLVAGWSWLVWLVNGNHWLMAYYNPYITG